MDTPTITPVDAFDAAVTAESTYVAPQPSAPVDDAAAILETPVAATPARDAAGKFAVAAPAEDTADAEAPVAEDKPAGKKPRHDPQARIDQAIARQREAERRADDAERKAREIEARTPPRQDPAPPAAPEKFPDYAAYLAQHPDASLEAWLDARDEWRDTKRETATRQQAEAARLEQTFTQRATSFSDQFAKAREADPAIESRINRDLLTVRPFSTLTAQDQAAIRAIPNPAERDRVAFLCFLADQWIDSDHAVALVEHLSDPKEFQRLATLPPTQVVRELAKVEARLGAAAPPERGAAPRPTASQARPPITPLGTTPHAAADDGSDDEPVEAFIRRENTKDRKAGRL